MENFEPTNQEKQELLEKLTNYPSISRVFADEVSHQAFVERVENYISSLEKVIIYGNADEAKKAKDICNSLQTTLALINEISKKM